MGNKVQTSVVEQQCVNQEVPGSIPVVGRASAINFNFNSSFVPLKASSQLLSSRAPEMCADRQLVRLPRRAGCPPARQVSLSTPRLEWGKVNLCVLLTSSFKNDDVTSSFEAPPRSPWLLVILEDYLEIIYLFSANTNGI
jgi:hypothetical protein